MKKWQIILILVGLLITQISCQEGYGNVKEAYFSRGVYNTEDPVTVQDRLPDEINADDLRKFDYILDSVYQANPIEKGYFHAIVLNKVHKGEHLLVLYYTQFAAYGCTLPFFQTISQNGCLNQNALAVDLITPINGIVRFHKKVNPRDVCVFTSNKNDIITFVGRAR